MHFYANIFRSSVSCCFFLFLHLKIRSFFLSRKIIFRFDRHQQLILQGKVFIVFHHYWIANLNLSLFLSFSCGIFFYLLCLNFFHLCLSFFLFVFSARLWIYLLFSIVIQSQHNLFRLFSQLCTMFRRQKQKQCFEIMEKSSFILVLLTLCSFVYATRIWVVSKWK